MRTAPSAPVACPALADSDPGALRTAAAFVAAVSNPNLSFTWFALNAVWFTIVPREIRPLRCGSSIVRAKFPAPITSSRVTGCVNGPLIAVHCGLACGWGCAGGETTDHGPLTTDCSPYS